jgi:hypothetical protein
MEISREVILDLVPLYMAGEASPATRALVEEYLAHDPEFDRRLRSDWVAGVGRTAPTALPPEIELRSLRRTRAVLGLQRWLFGFGLFFVLSTFSLQLTFSGSHLTDAHFVLTDYPALCALSFAVGCACFAAYLILRWRLRARGSLTSVRRSS